MAAIDSDEQESERGTLIGGDTERIGSESNYESTAITSSAVEDEEGKPRPPMRDLTFNEILQAMGTTPRRFILGNLLSVGIALAGNFLGVTSKLLTFVPEESVEITGLDTYFPRGDYKRIKGEGYTFVIPKEWVADTFVALAKAQRQAAKLDYTMKRRRDAGVIPDEAFGPPGRLKKNGVSEQGDTNVSMIVSKGLKDFSLRGTLGSPTEAAESLLRLSLAPEGSGRVGTLLTAAEDTARNVYQFEYEIDRGERGVPLRAASVIAGRGGTTLYTLTVVAPRVDWNDPSYATKLRKVADSFHLF